MAYKMTDEHKEKIKQSLIKYKKENPATGNKNSNWRGGIRQLSSGYKWVYAPEHPFCSKGKKFVGYVLEHRLKVEKLLIDLSPKSEFLIEISGKKYLSPNVIIHHKNRERWNNNIENLEIISSQSEHLAGHNSRHETGKGASAKHHS